MVRVEIPECRRCCFCLPLRYGVMIFGYLNLGLSVFIVTLDILIAHKEEVSHRVMMLRGVQFYAHVWCGTALYVIEILFTIVLLMGFHIKSSRLLRAYYYYGITSTLASLVTLLVLNSANGCSSCWSTYFVISIAFVFCSVAIQVYLLLLVRSVLIKFQRDNSQSFVNHTCEVMADSPLQTGHNPF